MTVTLWIKQAGKKSALTQTPLALPENTGTLRQMIEHIAGTNAAAYNAKAADSDLIRYLLQDEIESQAATGKVGFGRRYGQADADPHESVQAALLAFTDGLYRVFVDEAEVLALDEAIPLREGSSVAFIRLVFLAGSLW
ncbi:MAG TPA: hypothetical protein PKE04_12725 [Clostridia bacterium]|nr:hypothetical protein [Clostridia bacterium]